MIRVLVVEDEPVLRLTFARFLEEAGYAVDAVEDAPAARDAVRANSPHVVVCDILLGRETGVDLLRWIEAEGVDAPVIMVTGEPNVDTAAEAVRLGAFDYLPKPVDRAQLLRVVRLAEERLRLARERDRFAEDADRARRELLAIFDSVRDALVMVDNDLRVVRANRSAGTLVGGDELAAGANLGEALGPPWTEAVQALAGTLATAKPADIPRMDVHGGPGPSRVYSVYAQPLTGGGGALLVVRDITRITDLESRLKGATRFQSIVGKNPAMRAVFQLIEDLSETTATVLICGESGTGKEGIAAAIQRTSPRKDGPYIRVNCAALPDDLLESELFGHVRGAFTGAVKDRVGRFEAAHGGTLLLDEIGDVSPRLQLRLLRVLQEQEFERVGDTRPRKSDARVIATTNQDLQTKIDAGTFRSDLYYRLNVVRVDVPPLRDRRDDIPLLAEHFLERYSAAVRKDIRGLAHEVLDAFMRYDWPGNVRELEHAIERATIVCRGAEIRLEHIPEEIVAPRSAAARDSARHPSAPRGESPDELDPLNRDRIQRILEQTGWNVAKSAKIIGVARNTLYSRIRKYGIEKP
jgi:two-component system, NtrC family, response regulator HydG